MLVVDDDHEIRDLLGRFLLKHGFRVTTAKDGQEMAKAIERAVFDLVVLDLMLPGENGLTLIGKLRAQAPIPVIMLTAMGEEADRVVVLEMGADDYLPKPFSPRELLARIRAVLRCGHHSVTIDKPETGVIRFDGRTLDAGRRRVVSPTKGDVELSAGEYDLLLAFATHPRKVLNRDFLLDLARGRTANLFDRSIDILVMRLRRKIEDNPADPKLIKTVRGGGYMFTAEITAEMLSM